MEIKIMEKKFRDEFSSVKGLIEDFLEKNEIDSEKSKKILNDFSEKKEKLMSLVINNDIITKNYWYGVDGIIPFVPVIPKTLLSLEVLSKTLYREKRRARRHGEREIIIKGLDNDEITNTVDTPAQCYFIIGIEYKIGQGGFTNKEGISLLKEYDRHPLTIEEGLMTCLIDPSIVDKYKIICSNTSNRQRDDEIVCIAPITTDIVMLCMTNRKAEQDALRIGDGRRNAILSCIERF